MKMHLSRVAPVLAVTCRLSAGLLGSFMTDLQQLMTG